MNRNTEYDVLYTDYCRVGDMQKALDRLKEDVNRRIKSGWEPLGGINSSSHAEGEGENVYFYQAMIKE